MRLWSGLLLALVLLAAGPGAAAQDWPKGRTEARDTRLGTHPDLTRLVLDVSEVSKFYTHVADEGRRILVGIPSVDWEANRHRLKPFGLIARFDFMRRGLKRGLLVIHTNAPARIEHQFTLPPDPDDNKGNRLVLDLAPRDLPGKAAMPKRVPKKTAADPPAAAPVGPADPMPVPEKAPPPAAPPPTSPSFPAPIR
ncbi:hypothetical protein [Magnetospirillum sp. UT-4]|uniref:hypothetical protein n=1 Tax=Magnetospirillum sp. UT-4 TaxID=2681467 RepID=UPI001383C24E|nr:hypothetical protein [Magnetospirillum sp. UT-4]CAA7623391.1 Putative N-acetylmuramoyl-L-alanine amidase (modular protein) [Magnetospirillum sp. UT-4]